jgi:hypothetical protein
MNAALRGLIQIISIVLFSAAAVAQVPLGTAQSFGVLGGSTVTNTGPTVVNSNVGVSPGSSVTGFPPGVVVGGTIHAADATAAQAQTDLTAAYNIALATPCTATLVADLGGMVLTPGVYCFSTSAGLTGTLTLDLQGNPNAAFLFKIGSTLTTASGSAVALVNSGGTTCPPNVNWQVGSSATLGTGSTFIGNILALTSITMTTGTTLNGRALARNGAVTLDSNTITSCASIVACPTITVNPATLPNGTVGVAYNQTITASGGTPPYTFTITSGSLPAGLTLNPATGALSGTPTTIGTSNFIVTATDASACAGSRSYTIVIVAATVPGAPGIPTLDFLGMAILIVALGGAAVFFMSRSSS